MFSHVVIFWTDPAKPNSTADLCAGAEKYLRPIPGVLSFHLGRMVGSHRAVVDQTYQLALNLVFADKNTLSCRNEAYDGLRSNVARRSSVRRSAVGDFARPAAPSFSSTKASIGLLSPAPGTFGFNTG